VHDGALGLGRRDLRSGRRSPCRSSRTPPPRQDGFWPPRLDVTHQTIEAAHAHTSRVAQAAAGHSLPPRGSSAHCPSHERRSTTQSHVASRHGFGDAPASAVEASRPASTADGPHRSTSPVREPTRARTCRATLRRASREKSCCGGDISCSPQMDSVGLLSTAATRASREGVRETFTAAEASLRVSLRPVRSPWWPAFAPLRTRGSGSARSPAGVREYALAATRSAANRGPG